MNLSNLTLTERKKLTSHYPVLLASETGKGKSYAFSQLSEAEKSRTVIFNFDNKQLSDDDSQFAKVYHDFDINDIDMIDKIIKDLISVFAYEKCDRVLLDTFTLMTKLFNRWALVHFKGFDVWSQYNAAITYVLETIKSCTLTYGKFAYVTAHYPPKDGAVGRKVYVTTKGKEHTNIIEESFSTVVQSVFEDRQVYLQADVFDDTDTTKTKLAEGHFRFKRKSIDDLELVLTKTGVIVDEIVVVN